MWGESVNRKEILSRIEFYEENLERSIKTKNSLDIACCKKNLAKYRGMLDKVSA